MSPERSSVFDHLKTAFWIGLIAGSLAGIFFLIRLPFFLDTVFDLSILSWLIPVILLAAAAILFYLTQRLLSEERRIDRSRLPLAYVISLFIGSSGILSAVLLWLFAGASVLSSLAILAITFVVWFYLMQRIARSSWKLDSKYIRWSTAPLIVCLFILYSVRSDFRHFQVPAKMFVFGVDGATWSIINPLIEKGKLKNIAALKKSGSRAALQSIEPTLSPVVWTSIATGKVAEKHGVVDFYSTQDSLRTRRVWDVLQANGMRIGLFKWLITWPPRKVNGFVIPDILSRDDRTFPPGYSSVNSIRNMEKSFQTVDLRLYGQMTWSLMKIGLRMSTLRSIGMRFTRNWFDGSDSVSTYISKRHAELKINKDVFTYLLKEYQPQFVTFYDNGVDILSHRYWKYYEPKHFSNLNPQEVRRHQDAIPEYYELIDQTLGDLMRHFSQKTSVLVISDHGMQAANKQGEELYSPKLSKILERLKADTTVYQIALGRRYYVRPKNAADLKSLATVRAGLEEIKVVETREKLFDLSEDETGLIVNVRKSGLNFDHHVAVADGELRMDEVVYQRPPYTGTHHIDGILLASGPYFKAGVEIPDATILDITPTILYLEKLPISIEIDGKILFPAISEDFRKNTTAHYVPESEADKLSPAKNTEFDPQIEERLRSLGYVQ